MENKIRKLSSRVLGIVLVSFLLMSIYYSFTIYNTRIEMAEKSTLGRLESISKTVSTQINGVILKMILEQNEEKDGIKSRYDNMYVREVGEILEKTVVLNGLESDIYTLTKDEDGSFYFGITSAEKQYFRHPYQNPPQILIDQYDSGGVIPAYSDEHGTWLSAFSPIKDNAGNTIAVVQADLPFDSFVKSAQANLYRNIVYSFVLITFVTLIMLYWLRILLRNEENMVMELESSSRIIAKKNKDITASISYAQRIQESLMDSEHKLKNILPDSFVLFNPKDMVSGDFYWIHSLSKDHSKLVVAAADCTGHGVPGAMVSVLGITFLRDIVTNDPDMKPGQMLSELNSKIITTFSEKGKMTSKDGMDISLAVIDKNQKSIAFSGAYRPIIKVSKGDLTETAGDKQPIGSDHFDADRTYTDHELTYENGDWIYMFSDGYIDQFGGERRKKFMKKRFKEMLVEMNQLTCKEQRLKLNQELEDWMQGVEQVDDITVLGFKL